MGVDAKDGNSYLNFQSATNKGAEIRAQIKPLTIHL
jgi:hypothetical protein